MIKFSKIHDVKRRMTVQSGKTSHFQSVITKIIIHSGVIPPYHDINVKFDFDLLNQNYIKVSQNYTFSVIRSSRQYLGSPYGQCSDYRDSDSKSRQLCYRKCFRNNIEKIFQCIPLFVDYYVSELDSIPNTTKLCSKSLKEFEPKLRDKCMKLCPKECLREEYSYRMIESDSRFGIDYWLRLDERKRIYSKLFQWDSSEPMFVYTEEPIMSLSDYLVNCGGLMGLWFGTSAKDIIAFIIESEFVKKLNRLFY